MSASKPPEFQRLMELWAEIDDLQMVSAILYWDEQTQMPRSGAAARADHKATLDRLVHERISAPEIGRLLEQLSRREEEIDYHSDEAGVIRVARRHHEQATKLPIELVTEFSRARSEAFTAWLKAREARDYTIFSPALQRIYELSRRGAEAIGYAQHPMDAFIGMREPGMKTADFDTLFAELRETLVPLVRDITQNGRPVDESVLTRYFDPALQWELGLKAVRAIDFDLDEGRADFSVHPFSISFSPNDTRITSRTFEHDFRPCFFGLLHEAGHGHYMQGIPVKYRRTPLADGASSGAHESQSRTWENLVGRSLGFWQSFYPALQQAFPEQTRGVSVSDWYRAVNVVQPSLIRVEADEVTYNLHIMIRFELEKAVYDGELQIKDLDQAWNAKFRDYLGIEPGNDLVGVLQDIHWTDSFGACFQGYTLGNVMSVQFYQAALRDNPSLAVEFARGDYSGLLDWSRKHIHDYGAKFGPQELMQVATGEALSAKPYLRYITEKFSNIYGLKK